MRNRYLAVLGLAGIVLVADQVTKAVVEMALPVGGFTRVIPGFFSIIHILNKGAAFGFLNRSDIQWQTSFFIAASILAMALILHLVKTLSSRDDRFILFALGLILGGALGNLLDRVRTGLVVDFLEFHVGQFYWPAFNVADIAISMGSFALIIAYYRKRGHPSGESRVHE